MGVLLAFWVIIVMADNALANVLAEDQPAQYPYGRPRFPNADPRAYFDAGTQETYRNEGMGDRLNDLRTTLPWALMGMRPGSASQSMRAFNPKAPEAPLPQRPEPAMNDNGWGQHVYESLLGRKRMSGQVVAEPESGGPLRSPLFWLLSALGTYGSYKLWGLDKEPWPWEESEAEKVRHTPGTPQYAQDQGEKNNMLSWLGDIEARSADMRLARQHGVDPTQLHEKQRSLVTWRDAQPYTDEMMALLAPYRLPGGPGNQPY